MGIATQPPQPAACASRPHAGHISPASMSQGYHQSIFSFSDSGGFDRSTSQEQQQQHIAQQSRRDKLRLQGFDAAGNPLVPIDEEGEEPPPGIYDSTPAGASNMLSDLFSFPPAAGPSATELLASQMSGGGYQFPPRPSAVGGFSGDWYGGRQGIVLGGSGGSSLNSIGESTSKHHHDGGGAQQHPLMSLNADSAAAMQLFLMNPAQPTPPPQRRSPSPPVPPPQTGPSALHHHAQAFQSFGEAAFGGGGGGGGGLGEGKGLSLSLSSSLQQFDMAKADELRVREGVLYFNNQQQQQHPALHLQGHGQGQQVHMSYGAMGVVNVLRNSKYARAAQQLLEEFCSVGRGQSKGSKVGRQRGAGSSNPKPSGGGASSSAAASSSTSKPDAAPLSSADKFEYQRKKAKLISMLDEVDRRYNHYCDQMQMVVNSFDSVMGFGAAAPYTALAQKAMSRHFRCLKDAIAAQVKQTCELLGDKEGASSAVGGITKGETPRLRLIDQSLRQQRAFHQMGMMEQEAWRPQRGLPERSVTILRAWLFEHFLHPYPSDADKHLLARQTGLSRNQVSNWFINARVRLWKPMVEDMYQQEFKDDDDDDDDSEKPEGSHHHQQQHSPPPPPPPPPPQQHQVRRVADATANAPPDGDPSASSTSVVSRHHYHHFASSSSSEPLPPALAAAFGHHHSTDDSGILIPGGMAAAADMYRYGAAAAAARFGTAAAAGDVSLTLGLRHAGGNAAEKGQFSVRDFGA